MTIIIEGQLTYEEFKQYSEYHTKKILMRYFISVFLIMFIAIYITMFEEFGWFLTVALPLSITYIGFVFLKFILKMINKRHYDQNPMLKQKMKYVISTKTIRLNSEQLQSKYSWEEIRSTIEYRDMFLLYVTKTSALILPKRYFQTKEDISQFKALLQDRLEAKKLKWM
ncbi:hypothetical protein BKP35_06590 [Anaerobacillus arseniciselenatis]|uniref:YcxB-like C-terminal domain-containing protein n=1 Tax=Anaerobacillus arseniciselenatis TaxID=85682 RepID=A0A1S2LPT1_9BACI|nr:YcxB family protein [Anaerobacillus arseniciselenatis]OIJ14539.1 hypothetical protein BKP35_06590 [Anaerobacillus arseniciselenatis]